MEAEVKEEYEVVEQIDVLLVSLPPNQSWCYFYFADIHHAYRGHGDLDSI